MQVRLHVPAREPAGIPPEAPGLRARATALVFLVLAIVLGAQALRTQLGLGLSLEAVQAWARNLGWAAPAAFVALVTCRQLVLLPALLLLTAGGLVFGGGFGALLGGTGLVLSALGNFACARHFGAAFLTARVRERIRRGSARGHTAILLFAALATAHPTGPLMLAQWTAGCSTVSGSGFLLAIAPTSYLRAGSLALFGSTLASWGSIEAGVLAAGLVGLVLLPLASRTVRRHIFGTPEEDLALP